MYDVYIRYALGKWHAASLLCLHRKRTLSYHACAELLLDDFLKGSWLVGQRAAC